MLDHGEKECLEKKQVKDSGGRGSAQYGPWLKGEPGKRFSREADRMEDSGGSGNKYRKEGNGRELRIQPKKNIEPNRKTGVGGKPVTGIGRLRENSPSPSDEVSGASRESLKGKHENGKVKS
ncbi:hypothetical protein CFP56_013713 [Quercus suber]|uniref:Uncharacterized protein n=1 Tax=Quercus suber TaxID=58331 RepID=A0AAW0KSC0_QUESU